MTEPSPRPERLCVVIGAMRCGTTTLFQLLQQVPQVCLTRIKEPDYFIAEKSLYRGPAWYAGLFADTSKLCVDVSPNYAKRDVFPGVAEQIHAFNPKARIVYIVRDPLKRALSEYHHQKAAGVELPSPSRLLDTPEGAHIVSTSGYASQLGEYRKVFPADQILVIDMDRFVAEPDATVSRILAFCGELSPIPRLVMSIENDRGSVERLPRFWLALRRTRFGDRIRDLVPAGLHRQLKGLGGRLLGRKASSSPTEPFDEATLARLSALLAPEADAFRAMSGQAFQAWTV